MTWTGTGRAWAEVLPGLGWDCRVWGDFGLLCYIYRYTLITVILCEPRRCQQAYSACSHFFIRARQSAASDVNVQKGVASS